MWPYYPELLASPVPRYTSYPTAADFGELPDSALRDALESANGDVSLYVHIPFCEKICFYCGCNTGRANRSQRLASYLDALHQEIRSVGSLLPSDARIRRVSLGGGSPNAIAPSEMLRLMEALNQSFAMDNPVLSAELDPRTMTAQWGEAMGKAGFQRASLGVQTFAPHCQRAIGRVQDEDLIVRSVDWLRGAGVRSINFDLMYGLPGQDGDDVLDSLYRSRALGADRIALFGYAHVPRIIPRQRAIDEAALPGQAERFAMAELGFRYLCTHGYTPVGFDHFAKPGADPLATAALQGTLRRNFQGFTDDTAPTTIGLGASSISSFSTLLAQNEKNSGRYRMRASQGLLSANRGIFRTADDRYRGAVIEQLLCQGRARIGARLMAEIGSALEPFKDRGLISIDNEWLSILPEGLPYARSVAACFDTYRNAPVRTFSSAV